MQEFVKLTSVAAPLLENAIDTDVIFPARFLLLLDRDGLGRCAFAERRGGAEPFVLDTPPHDEAEILVAGENFGTGSSREHAVWALADLGIRCVIARSFGDIFFANCFKNGVLPIRLSGADMQAVEDAALAAETLTVDLETQEVRLEDGRAISFDIDAYRKRALLAGLDEIGMILTDNGDDIAAFEKARRRRDPWLEISADRLEAVAGSPGGAE